MTNAPDSTSTDELLALLRSPFPRDAVRHALAWTSSRLPRRQRKPNLRKLIQEAEKAGKPLASVTLPDGTRLEFGQPEPTAESNNPWLADLNKKAMKR